MRHRSKGFRNVAGEKIAAKKPVGGAGLENNY